MLLLIAMEACDAGAVSRRRPTKLGPPSTSRVSARHVGALLVIVCLIAPVVIALLTEVVFPDNHALGAYGPDLAVALVEVGLLGAVAAWYARRLDNERREPLQRVARQSIADPVFELFAAAACLYVEACGLEAPVPTTWMELADATTNRDHTSLSTALWGTSPNQDPQQAAVSRWRFLVESLRTLIRVQPPDSVSPALVEAIETVWTASTADPLLERAPLVGVGRGLVELSNALLADGHRVASIETFIVLTRQRVTLAVARHQGHR